MSLGVSLVPAGGAAVGSGRCFLRPGHLLPLGEGR